MRYLVRLNPKAFNQLTRKVNASRLWEIEQCAFGVTPNISEKVIWHCAEVRVDDKMIQTLFTLPGKDEKPWEAEFFGICVRGQDNAVEIKTGAHDVSGN